MHFLKWLLLLLPFCACNKKIFSSPTIQQLEKQEYLTKLHACHDDCILIDVRTPHEYRKAHLDNAINISYILGRFNKKIKRLDHSKTIFLYCQTAHRSPLATKKLKRAGFTKIYDLKDGYQTIK